MPHPRQHCGVASQAWGWHRALADAADGLQDLDEVVGLLLVGHHLHRLVDVVVGGQLRRPHLDLEAVRGTRSPARNNPFHRCPPPPREKRCKAADRIRVGRELWNFITTRNPWHLSPALDSPPPPTSNLLGSAEVLTGQGLHVRAPFRPLRGIVLQKTSAPRPPAGNRGSDAGGAQGAGVWPAQRPGPTWR